MSARRSCAATDARWAPRRGRLCDGLRLAIQTRQEDSRSPIQMRRRCQGVARPHGHKLAIGASKGRCVSPARAVNSATQHGLHSGLGLARRGVFAVACGPRSGSRGCVMGGRSRSRRRATQTGKAGRTRTSSSWRRRAALRLRGAGGMPCGMARPALGLGSAMPRKTGDPAGKPLEESPSPGSWRWRWRAVRLITHTAVQGSGDGVVECASPAD